MKQDSDHEHIGVLQMVTTKTGTDEKSAEAVLSRQGSSAASSSTQGDEVKFDGSAHMREGMKNLEKQVIPERGVYFYTDHHLFVVYRTIQVRDVNPQELTLMVQSVKAASPNCGVPVPLGPEFSIKDILVSDVKRVGPYTVKIITGSITCEGPSLIEPRRCA